MTTEAQTTEQTLAKILTLCKNNGTTLDELLKLPVLDAEGKIPAAALRIVGALSAGAVIESGDNANGEYIRWADGTQICWGTTPELSLQFNAYGNIFQASYVITFPAEFVDANISCAASVTVGTGAPWANVQTPTVSLVTIRVFDTFNRTNTLKTVFRWFAIGKWK